MEIDSQQHLEISRETYVQPTNRPKIRVSTLAVLTLCYNLFKIMPTIHISNRRAFYMRMRACAERQQRGRIKSDGEKSKTRAQSFSGSHFRWCFEYCAFLQKIFFMTKIEVFQRVFSCRFFSSRFSWLLKTSRLTGKAMHFYGLISRLVVLLIKEEMHRSNVQLV